MLLFLIILTTFLFGFFFTPILIRFSIKKNFYKNISERDIHSYNITNIGGVSIFLSFTIGFLLISYFYNELFIENIQYYIFFILSCFFIFLIGLYDDVFNVSFIYKFILQFILAFFFVYLFDIKIESFYGLFGLFEFSYTFLKLFSVLVFVFIMNSYNLIDGVDGLASSIGIFINLMFGLIFYKNCSYFDFSLSILLVVCLVSFFYYNKPNAKIFMGDSGSLFIGFLISYLSIKVCNLPIDNSGTINPVIILCILSYPSIDTLRVFSLRIFKGNSPFKPDRNHIHHYMINKKFNHIAVSYFAIMYSVILTIICYLIRDYITLSFFLMVSLAILFIVFPMASFARTTTKKILSIFK